LPADRPTRVSIGEIAVRGASAIEARRLADALPAALERALSGRNHTWLRPSPADRVAAQIVEAMAEHVRETGR
jgi:hypothetical protein